MLTRILLSLGILLAAAGSAEAGPPNSSDDWGLLKAAIFDAGPAGERAIAELRAGGPASLGMLLETRDRIVRMQALVGSKGKAAKAAIDPEQIERTLRRLETVIDRVAGQRYAHISGLYWYTDLDRAKAAAAASGKPILSLSMLGNLTDEFSCANSRFFRTTLYANQEISARLREKFVLHWKSVRPVPRVTIDFGDGRRLERTLTGNSAHYVLAADGTPLDVLPGLYGPRPFLDWLDNMEKLHAEVKSLAETGRNGRLLAYHARRRDDLVRQWQADLLAADSRARDIPADPQQLARAMTDMLWHKIAWLERHRVELDDVSRRIVRRENAGAARAGALAVTKRAVEDPILRLVRTLQETIALDSVRNEYTLHRQAHEWFAAAGVGNDVERLNERVYAELFLTPTNDPWLGLARPDVYTALTAAGVVARAP